MNEPIAISSRAADSIRNMLEQSQRLQDALRTFVEALGAQLDIPQGWRFDVQTMAFMPPQIEPEIPGLSQEFVARHEDVFCSVAPDPEQERH